MTKLAAGIGALGALLAGTSALAADADAGKAVFQAQCLLCHTAEDGDGGGAQGPALGGVVNRLAGTERFAYTPAILESGLVWDHATLDRFLAAPTNVAPGTTMVIAVPSETDRADIIAYLQSTSEETSAAAGQQAAGVGADWRDDAPGRVHRIDPNALPAPFATEAARNFPTVIARPADAELSVPDGFHVAEFASGLQGPRRMMETPDGDVLVVETTAGRIKLMRPSADMTLAASIEVFAEGLQQPFGIAFYPNAENPEWLYVAETNRIVRFPYHAGDMQASGAPEVVVPELSPSGGGHYSRDIAFSPDGSKFYVSVGSGSNVAENMGARSPQETADWAASHVLGATWGNEERRADVLVFDVDGDTTGKVFATGLRNCVRLNVQPQTGDVWCTVNERDMLGDDLVPDYSTRVREGAFYGWPWYYFGNNEDPRRAGERPDLAGKATVPDVPYQAHSASVGMLFYQPSSGPSAFPAEYAGDAFAVFHGSWNRENRTGHKVVRVLLDENGHPTGAYEDFLTGFVVGGGDAWARPSSLVELSDGSLLLSEDGGHRIFRISYGD